MRTFDEVWCDLEKLKGKKIYTLIDHVKNDIVDVRSNGLLRHSERGHETYIASSEFKRVWEKLTKNGHCEIVESGPLVFACIALLPEVEYSLNPATIWLSENRHDSGKLVEKI